MAETATVDIQPVAAETPTETPQELPVEQPAGEEAAPAPEVEAAVEPDEFNLPDETVGDLVEHFEDKILTHPKAQERIQREAQQLAAKQVAEMRGTPQADAEYTQFVNAQVKAVETHQKAVADLAPLLQAIDQGQDIDPRQAAGLLNQVTRASTDAIGLAVRAYGQEARVVVNGVLDDAFGDLASEQILSARGEKVTVSDEFRDLNRAYESMVANNDPRATQNFLRRAVHLAREAGKVEGAKEQATKGKAETERQLRLRDKNTEIQELAKLAAARRNGSTAAAAEGAPKTGPLSVEEAQNLPIDELIKRTQAQ